MAPVATPHVDGGGGDGSSFFLKKLVIAGRGLAGLSSIAALLSSPSYLERVGNKGTAGDGMGWNRVGLMGRE